MKIRLCTTTLNEALTLPALAKGCREMGIDSWLILDDEETIDNTEQVAYEVFDGIPGSVIKGKFDTLSAKRNYLLNCPEANEGLTTEDYWFITQADEPPSGTLDRSHMTSPVIMCTVVDVTKDESAPDETVGVPVEWDMPVFVKVGTRAHWEGTVHELLLFDEPVVADKLSSPRIHRYGSHATREMREYQAQVLEEELAKDDSPRAAFYLAQTYQNLGRIDDSIAMYLHRATQSNGYDQEQYCAMYRAGQLFEQSDPFKAFRAYMDAWSLRPNRQEPLFHLAHILNGMGNHEAALMFCNQALMMPPTMDSMFVERWVENWGVRYQWSVAAWWCGIDECYAVMDELLARTDLPKEHRQNIETNRALPPRAALEAQVHAQAEIAAEQSAA